MIKTFYKYRPIINKDQLKFALDVIENQRLYLSPINHFSDPFDAFNKSRSHFKNLKSLSLTENGDNILLWSYYTSWHSGIMIELKINLSEEPFKKLKEVQYTTSISELKKGLKSGNHLIKSSSFNHEKEWRAIFDGNMNFISFNINDISSITIGHSLLDEYKSEIIKSCNELEVPIYEYEYVKGILNLNKKTFANNV